MALAAVKGEKTLAELPQQFDVHPNQIATWRGQLLEGAAGVFGSEGHSEPAEPTIDVKTLHAKLGELTLLNDFCPGRSAGRDCCWAQNDDRPVARIAVARQARELGISRQRLSSAHAQLGCRSRNHAADRCAAPDFSFAGRQMLRDLLAAKGIKVNRLHVSALMNNMAIEAIYRRPNTSKSAPGHKIYPYLFAAWR